VPYFRLNCHISAFIQIAKPGVSRRFQRLLPEGTRFPTAEQGIFHA